MELTDDEQQRVQEVLTEHRAFVEAVARQYAPSPQDVPDIVQTVGLQVCRGLRNFRGEAKMSSWLFRITVNAARANYRSQHRHERIAEAWAREPEPTLDPDVVVATSERQEAVHDAIRQLPRRQRRCVQRAVRSDFDGRSILLRKKRFRADVRARLRDILTGDPRITATEPPSDEPDPTEN